MPDFVQPATPNPAPERPTAWWEWPFVVLALPLVFARAAWRWSASRLALFTAWLGRLLAAPLRWLRRLLAAPLRWLEAVGRRLMRIPAWVWRLLAAVYAWAHPGLMLPWRLIAGLAELLWRGMAWVARWASTPARRLWPAARWLGSQIVRGLAWLLITPVVLLVGLVVAIGRLLAVPARRILRSLAAVRRGVTWPFRATACMMRRGMIRLAGPWQRVRERLAAGRRRMAATRGRIAARLGFAPAPE